MPVFHGLAKKVDLLDYHEQSGFPSRDAPAPGGTRMGFCSDLVEAKVGAEGGTRTPIAFRLPAPKTGASANSATPAHRDSV